MSEIRDRMEAVLTDRSSGSADITGKVVTILIDLLENGERTKATQFIKDSSNIFPDMHLLTNLRQKIEQNGLDLTVLRKFEEALRDTSHIHEAAGLITPKCRILAFSNSGTLRAVLKLSVKRIQEVYCCRSLPGGEGSALAAALREVGIKTTLIADAEASRYLQGSDLALVGADAYGPDWFVNKVGTLQLALLCRHFQIPLLCIATQLKFNDTPRPDSTGRWYETVPSSLVRMVTGIDA